MPQRSYFTIDNRTSTLPTGSTGHSINLEQVEFDTAYIVLPEYFTQSSNPQKSVRILFVRLYDLVNETQYDASLHSTLLQFNNSADNYICATNIAYPHPKSFIVGNSQQHFEVWFRKMNGEIIDLTPAETRMIIEMELEY